MQENSIPKRFIAGAVCPKCQTMDSTLCFYQGATLVRECAECGFSQKLDQQAEEADRAKPQVIKIKELDG